MEQSKFYQIKNITEQEYTLVGCDGSVITRPIQDVDKSSSAFTIQDAKDGDVLISHNNQPFIYNGNFDSFHVGAHCGITITGAFVILSAPCDWTGHKNLHPATKEQRELLFSEIKEAGYTFDFEKKELKKIEKQSEQNSPILSNSSNIGKNLQVDGFNAELNALLKKYEHLSKKELQEPLEFYLGVVRDDLDIVREEKPKWNEEMKFRKFDIITNGEIEYEIRDIQKNQLGDCVYILYNANIARLSSPGAHLPDGSTRWVCEQVDKQFKLKQRMEE